MATTISKLKIGTGEYQFNAIQLGGHSVDYFATDAALDDAVTKLTALMAGALEYKGSLLSSSSTTGYTPAATKGDVYIVAVAGTVNGLHCEAGDLWLCNATSVVAGTSSNTSTVNASWDVVQGNIDASAFAKSNHKHSVTAAGTVGSRSITPEGTVSQPTFSGTASKHTHTVASHEAHTFAGTPVQLTGTFKGSSSNVSGNYTPAGTISDTSITPAGTVAINVTTPGSSDTPVIYSAEGTTESGGGHTHTGKVSISYTPAGTLGTATGTANYTPAGTVASNGSHTHDVNVSINYTPAGSNADDGAHTHSVSASGKFTPSGSITTPTSGGTGHTHTITKGTADALTGVSGELTASLEGTDTLVLSHTITATKASFVNSVNSSTGSTALGFSGSQGNVSVSGTAASAGSHTHTFTGTAATLSQKATAASAGGHSHTFNGTGVRLIFTGTAATLTDNDLEISTSGSHTHGFTGAGKMLGATFTGTAASHKHTFSGDAKAIGGTVTPAGTVTIGVGTGTANYTPAGTISTTAKTLTTNEVSITPAGTVSKPTFTGTPASHDHSFTGSAVNSGTEK